LNIDRTLFVSSIPSVNFIPQAGNQGICSYIYIRCDGL
jgi:hypothetical protein